MEASELNKHDRVQVTDPNNTFCGTRGTVVSWSEFPDSRVDVLIRMDGPDPVTYLHIPTRHLKLLKDDRA